MESSGECQRKGLLFFSIQLGNEQRSPGEIRVFLLKRMTCLYHLCFRYQKACNIFLSDLVNDFPSFKEIKHK